MAVKLGPFFNPSERELEIIRGLTSALLKAIDEYGAKFPELKENKDGRRTPMVANAVAAMLGSFDARLGDKTLATLAASLARYDLQALADMDLKKLLSEEKAMRAQQEAH